MVYFHKKSSFLSFELQANVGTIAIESGNPPNTTAALSSNTSKAAVGMTSSTSSSTLTQLFASEEAVKVVKSDSATAITSQSSEATLEQEVPADITNVSFLYAYYILYLYSGF